MVAQSRGPPCPLSASPSDEAVYCHKNTVVSAELQELRTLVAQLGGQSGAAAVASIPRTTLRTYLSGRTAPTAGAMTMLRWAASVRVAVLDERAEMTREREELEQLGGGRT